MLFWLLLLLTRERPAAPLGLRVFAGQRLRAIGHTTEDPSLPYDTQQAHVYAKYLRLVAEWRSLGREVTEGKMVYHRDGVWDVGFNVLFSRRDEVFTGPVFGGFEVTSFIPLMHYGAQKRRR